MTHAEVVPLGIHFALRLANDAVIAATPGERRVLARVVLAKARQAKLLSFAQADTHLHLVAACTRAEAGRAAQVIEVSLRRRLCIASPFARAVFWIILDAHHLRSAFRYVLRQPQRHQLEVDPRREDSNLPDLLGLRPLGSYTAANVRRLLPRVSRTQLLELLGVGELPAMDGPVENVLSAVRAAAALPALAGSSREVVEARCAVLEIVGRRLDAAALADALAISRRSVQLLRHRPADRALVQATRLQLGWRRSRRLVSTASPPRSVSSGSSRPARCGAAPSRTRRS